MEECAVFQLEMHINQSTKLDNRKGPKGKQTMKRVVVADIVSVEYSRQMLSQRVLEMKAPCPLKSLSSLYVDDCHSLVPMIRYPAMTQP